jgi:hypothetical protein
MPGCDLQLSRGAAAVVQVAAFQKPRWGLFWALREEWTLKWNAFGVRLGVAAANSAELSEVSLVEPRTAEFNV